MGEALSGSGNTVGKRGKGLAHACLRAIALVPQVYLPEVFLRVLQEERIVVERVGVLLVNLQHPTRQRRQGDIGEGQEVLLLLSPIELLLIVVLLLLLLFLSHRPKTRKQRNERGKEETD